MRSFNRILIALVLAGWLVTPFVAKAAEDQFYFAGKVVVSSDPVPGARHIYLRWDAIEGQLPADIVLLRLKRNGDQLAEWPVNAVMPASDIDALYRGADQQRQKLETITRLNEIASEAGDSFSASQFASALHRLIDPSDEDAYNPLWAFLGSRTDFNIARARYRAWVDTLPVVADGKSVVEYELLGVNAADVAARLGYVEIDPTTQQQSLGATALRQIRVSDWRCDLPEGSKDNYTVMLDWQAPGASNIADRVASQAYISGYDLYRTIDNLGPTVNDAPVRDIAALAAAATTDSRGRPIIAGLEKVNVPLIIDSGAPSFDAEWLAAKQYHVERLIAKDGNADGLPTVLPQNVPMEPKWLEARDQLMRAGLKPGDRRAYYLVPRDFTGHYGPSVGAVVEVPLMTRPPAPWNLRTFADQTSAALNQGEDALTFTWDEVNLSNYMKMYQGTREFCNATEAQSTGLLEYVPAGASCATSPHNAVRLDVRDYRIYRFENFDIAGRFKDSDGDGVEDSFETPDLDNNGRVDAFERSVGLQCDVSAQPANAKNYLVYSWAGGSVDLGRPSIFNPNAPAIARMRDIVPAAGNKDTVYWYRIVSEAKSPLPIGRLSFMSAPQRGLFPNRERPQPPDVVLTKPGEGASGCEITSDPGAPWGFSESLSNDPKGTSLEVKCPSAVGTFLPANLLNTGGLSCNDIRSACAGQTITLDFIDETKTGGVECVVDVPADIDFCAMGSISVVPDFGLVREPALAGDNVPGGASIDETQTGDTCIAYFENIDGTATRLGSTCDPGGFAFTPEPGLFCGYSIATDENNNISETVQFPCVITPTQPKTPSPPQVLTFAVNDSAATFTFRMPAESVAMAMARLDQKVVGSRTVSQIEAVPVIGNEDRDSMNASIPVAALQAGQDTFCLRLMSVGPDDGSGNALRSGWSAEKCFTRTAAGEDLPQYLPWPAVQGAVQGAPLQAALVTNYYDFTPFLAFKLGASPELAQAFAEFGNCWIATPDPAPLYRQDFHPYACLDGGHARAQSFLAPQLRFILYRQQRVIGGTASDWVQVSPLIEYAHFDQQLVDIGRDDGPIRVWTLNDPFVKASPDVTDPALLEFWFVDRYPFQLSADMAGTQLYEWRYQAVYFDAGHRPVTWRASDWFREGEL